MNISKIIAIAKKAGIKDAAMYASIMSKKDLIRTIQKREGNTPCFLTNVNDCSHTECLWREDCQIKF